MSKLVRIKGFPNYCVSDAGEVFSLRFRNTNQIKKLKPMINRDGYAFVDLRVTGKRVAKKIHRIVAEAFIPNPENKPQVNHKNGVKTDNRVENLEWVTNEENMRHSFAVLGHKSSHFGKRYVKFKIILQIKDGETIAEFNGVKDIEVKTGINHRHISDCCNGKRKMCGGFSWKYKGS